MSVSPGRARGRRAVVSAARTPGLSAAPPRAADPRFPASPAGIVYLVEDDLACRHATARLLSVAGYDVRTFAGAAEFLLADAGPIGCVVLDLELPGASGLDIQEALIRSATPLPVVFLSGHAQIADSVRAMKSGAVDFLTKTADATDLLAAIDRALAGARTAHERRTSLADLRARYESLTPREREVFAHLISGQLNKQVGFDLGISEQTTKIHRHRVLEKMGADSIPHLVRMAADLGVRPVGRVR